MKEANQLTGSKLTKEAVELIYEKIHADYTNSDFDKALFSAMSEGDILYPNLLKWLNYYREIRIENEERTIKKKEKEEIKATLSREIRDNCKYDYKCKSCPKEYCNIVNRYGFKLIFSILSGDNKENALHEASEKFPEIWKKYIGGKK